MTHFVLGEAVNQPVYQPFMYENGMQSYLWDDLRDETISLLQLF